MLIDVLIVALLFSGREKQAQSEGLLKLYHELYLRLYLSLYLGDILD